MKFQGKGLDYLRRGAIACLMVTAILVACTEANLYHRSISPAQADRVTFRGEVCTEDPRVSHFPLKVIFLVDQSSGFSPPPCNMTTGGLFTDFDPEQARIRAMRDLVGQYQRDETVSFAVIGYAGSPRVLAPLEGSFTRNVGEIEGAIGALGIPQGCEGENSCRDLRGALGTAKSVIEGDLTELTPGGRSMTRYVVILMNAGPVSPLPEGSLYCQRAIGGPACCDPTRTDCQRDLRARICCNPSGSDAADPTNGIPCVPADPGTPPYCCPGNDCDPAECAASRSDCATGVLVEDVRVMREIVEEAGAASFHLHALHLAAEMVDCDPTDDLAPNEAEARLLQDMAFAGAGEFYAYYDGSALEASSTNLHALQLLRPQVGLEAKDFIVFNLNALPTESDEPLTDTDADGLADVNEAEHGTDPGNADTDGDGITDYVEILIEFSPLATDRPIACEGMVPGMDTDNDLLTDCDEELLGTDPSLLDSDGDAMPDRLEVTMGTDYVIADWLDDADNDGVPNGDEVRQHTDPRSSDAASHLATQYRYTIVDEGLRARIEVAQPRTITGIEVQRATDDSSAGLGWLCYEPVAEGEGAGGWLCWLDPGERTDAGSTVSCNACDPNSEEGGGVPIRVDHNGSYELPSRSHEQPDPESIVDTALEEDLLDLVLAVQITIADLPPREAREQLLINRDERHCLTFVVRNVRLAGTGETTIIPEEGWNNIALYFAQAPQGRLTVPGIFRLALIPVRFIPPARREPPDAELRVWDDEFFRAGTFE